MLSVVLPYCGEATLSIGYENIHEVNLFHWKYLDFVSITPLDLTLEFLKESGHRYACNRAVSPHRCESLRPE